MMHRNAKPATMAEAARNTRIMALSCVVCALKGDFSPRPLECHHIVRGNKRLGHWYTLQLYQGHHRGLWTDQVVKVGIADGRHRFKEAHGYDELDLWQKLQVTLGLDDTLPKSKLVARRAA
ncbi:MAG: Recombination enhancement, RecA-dependent nuclease [Gammaproteobacteria bacterium]|nr:Recombination enhancement, RecA-dependent nuclease [Gammaproteobacteria bacterium]